MLSLLTTRVSEHALSTEAYAAVQSHNFADFFDYLLPEAIVLLTLLGMLMIGFSRRLSKDGPIIHRVAAIGLLGALLVCMNANWESARAIFLDFGHLPLLDLLMEENRPEAGVVGSMLSADGLSHFFRIFLLITGLLTVWMGVSAREMRDRSLTEFYILFLGSLAGMLLLASASHMLMVYLAIEMMSLPSYVLVALRRNQRRATEASLKYMLFGSVASGAMVYGLSLIYGMTGGLSFPAVAEGIAMASAHPANSATLGIGLFLFIVGIGYKMSIAPMHFWAPDAYEGAPTPVVAFLSVASKAAGFAAALRFVWMAAGAAPSGVGSNPFPWVEMLAVLGVLTMTIGNLAALRQTNVKRLLAYSSIAHAGYMMIAVTVVAFGRLTGNDTVASAGLLSCAVYLVAYLITNYGAFAAVVAVENHGNDNEHISAFRAMRQRNMFLAVCMFIILLSLLGVPPTLGFLGKFMVFKAGIEMIQHGSAIMTVMLIAAAINTAISAYYYFVIAREMFLVEGERGTFRPFQMPIGVRGLIGLSTVGIIGLFVMFGWLSDHPTIKGSENVIRDGRFEHSFGVTPSEPDAGEEEAGVSRADDSGSVVGRE